MGKEEAPSRQAGGLSVDRVPGFEPGFDGSKPSVLPLDDSRMTRSASRSIRDQHPTQMPSVMVRLMTAFPQKGQAEKCGSMATQQGFEPRLTGSDPAVLPLDDRVTIWRIRQESNPLGFRLSCFRDRFPNQMVSDPEERLGFEPRGLVALRVSNPTQSATLPPSRIPPAGFEPAPDGLKVHRATITPRRYGTQGWS